MFQELYEIVRIPISIILSGISIKLLDDTIDNNNINYIPYFLCLICISVVLWYQSSSLLLSSYIVGMFHDEGLSLISGLKAFQEQVIVFILSILLSGIVAAIFSLCIIIAIQVMDDIMDEDDDRKKCKKNWAVILGRVEAVLFMSVFFILSLFLDPMKAFVCFTAAMMISFFFNIISKKRSHNKQGGYI